MTRTVRALFAATLLGAILAPAFAQEAVIRKKPSQYLWAYHRYKAPRPGEAGA